MHTVGFATVSHSENLTKNVVELTSIMTSNTRIVPAGGINGGGFGTSFKKIRTAIESVYSDNGTLILVDSGSAVMTTGMIIETFERKKVEMMNCPLVEDAMVTTIDSVSGVSFKNIKTALTGVGRAKRFWDIV